MSGIPVDAAGQAGPVGLQGAELMWVGLQEGWLSDAGVFSGAVAK